MADKGGAFNKQGQMGQKNKQGTGDFGPPGASAKSGAGVGKRKKGRRKPRD